MGLVVNASDKKSIDDVTGGGNRPKDGTYCLYIKGVREFEQKNPNAVFVDMEVVSGTIPGQEGKEADHAMFLNDDGTAKESMLRFAMAADLIKPGEQKEVVFAHSVGRFVIARFATRKKQKKDEKTGKWVDTDKDAFSIDDFGMAIWPVGHPEVKDVPVNKAALDAYRNGSATAPQRPTAPAQQQPASAQPAQPAAAALTPAPAVAGVSNNAWDDV